MKKIGITFTPPDNAVGMFSSGIRQNALYFTELLSNIGYNVSLIIHPSRIDKLKGIYGFDGKYQYTDLSNIFDEKYDIVFQFGFEISDNFLIELKKNNVKLIQYNCSNDYIYDMEHALFSKDNKETQFSRLHDLHPIFDQIWSIPQMANSNLHYWATLYKTKCIEVPFIWSPLAIEQFEQDCIKSGIGDFKYKPKNSEKKLAIFEPNLNVFKWAFPALLVCENAYRNNKDIKHVYVTNVNSNSSLNVDFFTTLVKPLDLLKDKKISIEGRYNTLYFMKEYADVAVSHQWENPLNYLYLDLAWMGWPIVHNAHLCTDIGYYYDHFNYEEGGKVLNEVIKNHDLNYEDYLIKSRKIIDRYLPSNKDLQDKYKILIENI